MISSHQNYDGDRVLNLDTMNGMSRSERLDNKANKEENLLQQCAELRRLVHQSMKAEEEIRLKENPRPTEEEQLYMAAFKEWFEPQVRVAITEMYKKGYPTQSSGFHSEEPDLQLIDGYFTIDEATKQVLGQMGVQVLRGADIGLPRNRLITMLRFRAKGPSLNTIKDQWDAIAAALPQKSLPPGIRPICDRAEEFREQYAPEHPSLDEARERYYVYLQKTTGS
jgi:hypothetical protein